MPCQATGRRLRKVRPILSKHINTEDWRWRCLWRLDIMSWGKKKKRITFKSIQAAQTPAAQSLSCSYFRKRGPKGKKGVNELDFPVRKWTYYLLISLWFAVITPAPLCSFQMDRPGKGIAKLNQLTFPLPRGVTAYLHFMCFYFLGASLAEDTNGLIPACVCHLFQPQLSQPCTHPQRRVRHHPAGLRPQVGAGPRSARGPGGTSGWHTRADAEEISIRLVGRPSCLAELERMCGVLR